jgi:arylsulfatase A-like enzyme
VLTPTTPSRTPNAEGGNVLVVLLDDVGAEQLAAFDGMDAPPYTPNLDALASQGSVFDRAYAYPTCSPSRAALLTGQHSWRHGLGGVILDASSPGLDDSVPTLVDRLAPHGVATAWIGKWHLGPMADVEHPLRAGFDRFSGSLGNLHDKYAIAESWMDYDHWERVDESGVHTETRYATTVTIDEAIEAVGALPEPWVVVVAPNAAHTPLTEPPEALLVEGRRFPGDLPYGGFRRVIQALDTELGRLLEAVDLADSTVLVMGDNGAEGRVVKPPLAAMAKGTPYEVGVRVGMIAAGRGVASGARSDALVSIVDLLPTAMELTGVPVTADDLDGVSLVPLLADPSAQVRQTVHAQGFDPELTWQMVRNNRFKLVKTGEVEELYDLEGVRIEGVDLLTVDPLSLEAVEALELLRKRLLPER